MNTTTIRSLGWLIGLILLFSGNLQAEVNLLPATPLRPVKSAEFLTRSNSAADPTPISLTATAGVPFNYEIPVLILENNTIYSSPELPGNGLSLSYDTYPPSIVGTPNATGVMNLTINATSTVNSHTETAWVSIILTVNPPTPISLTATAGVPFNYKIPVLLPYNNAGYTSPQIPGNGLSLSYDTYPPSIVGTPNATGVMNLTISAHANVNSQDYNAWVPITLTVNSPTPISLTATAGVPFNYEIPVLLPYNNAGYTSPQIPGNGLSLSYNTYPPSIVGTPNTTGVMNLTISAHANVNSQDYNAWVPITLTVNPGSGGTLTLLAPTYNCATGAFRFNTSGGDSTPITFFAIGITGPTTNPDQFVDTDLRTAADAQPLLLQATQSGVTVTYLWDIRAQCPVTPSGGALTLLAPTYNCATGAFQFNTSGGDSSPITFFAIGITSPTTNPDQFVDTELRTAADVQPFQLQATQSGVTVTYVWDLKAACGRLRLAAPEPVAGLSVVVLGNPVVGELVQVEIRGAEGQSLRVALTNQQGRPVSEERIKQAGAIERLSVKLSPSPGVHLLQVSSSDHTEVVRVLKTD